MPFFRITFVVVLIFCLFQALSAQIKYIHPLPESRLHSPGTNIIVRFDDSSELSINDVQFMLSGSSSGFIDGNKIMSSDGETFIFDPHPTFAKGETISFTIKAPKREIEYSSMFQVSATGGSTQSIQEVAENDSTSIITTSNSVRVINGVSVPGDFPDIRVQQNGETADGSIFVTTFDLRPNYVMILQNDGTPLYYRESYSRLWDMTVQEGDILSVMEGMTARTYDQHFEPIHVYAHEWHGYSKRDHHEFQMDQNGHVLLIIEDREIIDMSQIVPGGQKNATVVGNHILEIDNENNVIFEWRCWDHYDILDTRLDNLTRSLLEYVHLNAIDIDYDGHILLPARTLDEITKINRDTGEIMWRLGGRKNQFEFVNDPDQFNFQHDIRAVPGKPNHYTIFDNGNYHEPPRSRAVEYQLDVENKTAEKVWEYRQTPDYYSYWMGSVQRLPNGNTGICWAHKDLPNFVEVDAQGNLLYEMEFEPSATTYRAHRHVWNGRAKRPYLLIEPSIEAVTLIFNQFGATDIDHYNVYADTTTNPVTLIDSTSNPYIHLTQLLDEKYCYFRVTGVDHNGNESEFSNEVEAYVNLQQPGENQVKNGDFSDDFSSWRLNTGDNAVAGWEIDVDEQLHVQVYETIGAAEEVQVLQRRMVLLQDRLYRLEFDAYADNNRPLEAKLMDNRGFRDYSELGLVQLSKRKKHFSLEFEMLDDSDNAASLFFNMGDMAGHVYLDNVTLIQIDETVVHDKQQSQAKPQDYTLYSAYPNPFNAQTTIRYALGQSNRVQLQVFDVVGRIVHKEGWQQKTAGRHQYIFDAADLSSGIYFCRIVIGSDDSDIRFEDMIKVMLIK